MQSLQKKKILSQVLGPSKVSGTEVLFKCPKCNHHNPKFSVNIAKDCWKCWVCGYSGFKLHRLVRRYGTGYDRRKWFEFDDQLDVSSFEITFKDLLLSDEEAAQENLNLHLPEEFETLATRKVSFKDLPARNYLRQRGLTEKDIIKWKIGYCSTGDYENRIIFPSFDINGNLNYFVGRSYEDDAWRAYKNPKVSKDIVFNHLFVDWTSDVILVEGIFDAIVAGNSVPLLGSSLSMDSKLFETIVKHDTPVYIALDEDADDKATNLIEMLLRYDIEIYKIDTSGYKDVGEMTKRVFEERKKKAMLITEENFLELRLLGVLI